MALCFVRSPFSLSDPIFIWNFLPLWSLLCSVWNLPPIASPGGELPVNCHWFIRPRLLQHHSVLSNAVPLLLLVISFCRIPPSSATFSSACSLGISGCSGIRIFRIHTDFPLLPSTKMLILHRCPGSQGFF